MPEILKLDRISMTFGGIKALENVSMKIPAHQIKGVIGPNGAGKTTLFNIITGIYKPMRGCIVFKGSDISSFRPFETAHAGIVRTFQNIRLFTEMTVIENVMTGMHHQLSCSENSFIWLLRAVSKIQYQAVENDMFIKASSLLKKLGISELAFVKASCLSYGQQRKVEIARALAAQPEILLLDEPAAGMNPTESFDLVSTIKDIRDEFNLTIILIEHDMKVVMNLCENISVLNYGKIISEGTPEEIKNDVTVINAYLGCDHID